MRMHRLPCASLLLALAGLAVPRAAAATQPTDFPSVRRVGPDNRIAGGARQPYEQRLRVDGRPDRQGPGQVAVELVSHGAIPGCG